MNKQDFMVGNIVELLTSNLKINLPTGKFGYIEEIREDKVKIRYDYESSEGFCYFNRRYNTIRPIKISEKILLELGFIKGKCKWGDDYVLVRDGLDIYFVIEHWTEVEEDSKYKNHWFIKNTIKPFNIQYLHQLQNLLYAITGETINFVKKQSNQLK